jgi:hypothetical protein
MGLNATLTLGNKKAVDIAVIHDGECAVTIDVKGNAKKMDWLLGNRDLYATPHHFVALVSYEGAIAELNQSPRVWLIPARTLIRFIKTASNGKTKYVSRKRFLRDGATFENNWQALQKRTP